jgi:hypothetical protein
VPIMNLAPLYAIINRCGFIRSPLTIFRNTQKNKIWMSFLGMLGHSEFIKIRLNSSGCFSAWLKIFSTSTKWKMKCSWSICPILYFESVEESYKIIIVTYNKILSLTQSFLQTETESVIILANWGPNRFFWTYFGMQLSSL